MPLTPSEITQWAAMLAAARRDRAGCDPISSSIDLTIDDAYAIQRAGTALRLERGEKVIAELPIRNVNRVVGTITGSDVPVAASGLTGITAISAGYDHSLARLSDGTVMAWGENHYGQLGSGSTTVPSTSMASSLGFGRTASSIDGTENPSERGMPGHAKAREGRGAMLPPEELNTKPLCARFLDAP